MCFRYNDVLLRCRELDSWTQDLSLPSVVWISGLFNPQSFLTGDTQHFSWEKEWEICQMCLKHLKLKFVLTSSHTFVYFSVAVMQSLARKNEWPLDKMNLTVDVTKKFKEEFNQPAREGAYIYGLYMEGLYPPSNHSADAEALANHRTFLILLFEFWCVCDRRCTLGYSGWDDCGGASEGINSQHACHRGQSRSKRPPGDA